MRIRCGHATLVSAISSVLLASVTPGQAQQPSAPPAASVTVFSYREPALTQSLLSVFTWTTGIKVNLVHDRTGLIERIAGDGSGNGADVLLTNDAGLLIEAKAKGATQPLASASVLAAVPVSLRDPDGHWFALSRNARVVVASKERVADQAITYEQLADPIWKGRICMRAGSHAYNLSLLASLIAHHGPAKSEAWLKGIGANLAMKPEGGDRDQIRHVAEGRCDLAIVNSYYLGVMSSQSAKPEQRQWAAAVRLIQPNAADRGAHVNISGMALAARAPNRPQAVRLMEFLASPMAQAIYVDTNSEYPVNPVVAPARLLKQWGPLVSDPLALSDIVAKRKSAGDIVKRVMPEGPAVLGKPSGT